MPNMKEKTKRGATNSGATSRDSLVGGSQSGTTTLRNTDGSSPDSKAKSIAKKRNEKRKMKNGMDKMFGAQTTDAAN